MSARGTGAGGMLEASRRGLARHLATFAQRQGYARPSDIPDNMRFTEWCEELSRCGLKVDRKPWSLANRPALRPIYDAIPASRAEARDRTVVVMKATQIGLTVWEMLAHLYMAIKFGPVNIGLYLPTVGVATVKSTHRFLPVVQSHPDLHRRLVHAADPETGRERKVGEGNVLTRRFGDSLFVFSWTSGKATTESTPLDIVGFDEVQEMTLDQIDKTRARMGDSEIRFALMLSTANMPELDIDYWYKLGDQRVWHTACAACGTASDLSDPSGIFPARSTVHNQGEVPGAPLGFVWTCPSCGSYIADPQVGRYIAQAPQNAASGVQSWLLPRTISPRITAKEMVTDFARAKTGNQRKSFFNRTLARPYIDPEQLPVTLAHLQAAARAGMEMGLEWAPGGKGAYMGVDQMGGYNAVIVKRRLPDGRQAVAHVEAIYGNDAFARLDPLMARFGVRYCVIEQLPNVNEARAFANRFAGRVYLAGYADLRDDMMVWGDDLSASDRRTAAEDRSRFTVTLSQYKAMQRTLMRLRDAECLWPDPAALEQAYKADNGEDRFGPVARDLAWVHYTKTALVVEHDPDTRKPRARVKKVGIDPHFAFATMLCDVAWSRDAGGTMFLLDSGAPAEARMSQPGAGAPGAAGTVSAAHGLPPAVRQMMESGPPPGTCGACASFREGMCEARGFGTRASNPACDLYVRAT